MNIRKFNWFQVNVYWSQKQFSPKTKNVKTKVTPAVSPLNSFELTEQMLSFLQVFISCRKLELKKKISIFTVPKVTETELLPALHLTFKLQGVTNVVTLHELNLSCKVFVGRHRTPTTKVQPFCL